MRTRRLKMNGIMLPKNLTQTWKREIVSLKPQTGALLLFGMILMSLSRDIVESILQSTCIIQEDKFQKRFRTKIYFNCTKDIPKVIQIVGFFPVFLNCCVRHKHKHPHIIMVFMICQKSIQTCVKKMKISKTTFVV